MWSNVTHRDVLLEVGELVQHDLWGLKCGENVIVQGIALQGNTMKLWKRKKRRKRRRRWVDGREQIEMGRMHDGSWKSPCPPMQN